MGRDRTLWRRPFLVMTRSAAIPVLNGVLAAPPTDVPLGPEDGWPTDCAASFDNLRVVPRAHLVDRICALGSTRLAPACTALNITVDCC